jgi:hypothetical protein
VLCIVATLLVSGCRKPESDPGLDLLPGDPLGTAAEVLVPHAFTFQDDPIRTSGLTRNLLGSYMDPQFGLVKAGIVAQLRLSSANVGAGLDNSSLVADSLVLALAFDGTNYAYGNLGAQRFQVFELAEDLSVDTIYQADDVPEVLPEDLVADRGGRLKPRPFNYVQVNGSDSLVPQLRIKLSAELAERFIAQFGTAQLADNASFLQFFKGLYITVDNGQQLPLQEGILYFNLLSSASKTVLYYRNLADQPELPRTYDFPINTSSVRYTVAEHQHAQALDPGVVDALADTTLAAARTYVQSLGGLRTAIRLPSIPEQVVAGRALARAELVLPVHGSISPFLPPPAQLFVFRRNANGEEVFLPDQLTGLGNIDGNYRPGTREYRFNITRYVQGVMNGDIPNTGIEVVPGSNGITANRVVLVGPDAPEDGMRVLLTFTTY